MYSSGLTFGGVFLSTSRYKSQGFIPIQAQSRENRNLVKEMCFATGVAVLVGRSSVFAGHLNTNAVNSLIQGDPDSCRDDTEVRMFPGCKEGGVPANRNNCSLLIASLRLLTATSNGTHSPGFKPRTRVKNIVNRLLSLPPATCRLVTLFIAHCNCLLRKENFATAKNPPDLIFRDEIERPYNYPCRLQR